MRLFSFILSSLLAASFLLFGSACEASQLWNENNKRRGYAAIGQDLLLFSKIFERVNPSVVNISALQLVSDGDGLGSAAPLQSKKRKNLGSGVIISDDGYIVTNSHVVESEAGLAVTLADGQVYRGNVIGKDVLTDIALIKINSKHLQVATLGNSDVARIGHWILAIGNPFGFNNTMTHGIVSGIGRVISPDERRKRFDNFIQVDAAINPGNSGGPLVDLNGDVIGINTAMTATGSGIAFAVPINNVKTILPSLRDLGYVPRGWIGIIAQEVSPKKNTPSSTMNVQLKVLEVVSGSPAEKAGVKKGDRLMKVNSKELTSLQNLSAVIAKHQPGTVMRIEIMRGTGILTVPIKVGNLESDTVE